MKIQLPSDDYSAEVWSFENKAFVQVHTDILRQEHFNDAGEQTAADYEMYLPYALQANQVGYIRISKESRPKQPENADQKANVDLTLLDSSPQNLIFELTRNTIKQAFSFNLQYYAASQGNDGYDHSSNDAEGAYLFKPDRHQRWQHPFAQVESKKVVQDLQYIK